MNQARLTALKAFDAGGGQIRFVAVMILNAGKDTKNSYYYTDITPDQITSALATNNARLVQIDSYLSGGTLHYPADPKSWWYTDMPFSRITALATAYKARLIQLERIPSDGNYNAIMVDCSNGCPASSWYVDQTPAQMTNLATQNGARVIGAAVLSNTVQRYERAGDPIS